MKKVINFIFGAFIAMTTITVYNSCKVTNSTVNTDVNTNIDSIQLKSYNIAQYGSNGEGFFQNVDSITETWYFAANPNPVLRLPSGGRCKFMRPYTIRKGWGMDSATVNAYFDNGGKDEDDADRNTVLQKVAQQPDYSYMDELINLQNRHGNLKVIWVVNIHTADTTELINAIDYMMKGGVKFIGFEIGNEVYSQFNTFEEYITRATPFITAIKKHYPGKKISLPCANFGGRTVQINWHNDLKAYAGDYDAITVHYYPNETILGAAYEQIPPKGNYTYPNQNLQDGFTTAFNTLMGSQGDINNWINQAKAINSQKEIWVTEFNTKPSNELGNTWVNSAWIFQQLINAQKTAKIVTIHNGVSADIYGMICRAQEPDSVNTAMVKRTGYFAYTLVNEMSATATKITNQIYNYTITKPGTYTYYYINGDQPGYLPNITAPGFKITVSAHRSVTGKYLYSSSGNTGWMNKQTRPNYEISEIKSSSTSYIYPITYGYITYTVSRK
jgi:hypothetical protein